MTSTVFSSWYEEISHGNAQAFVMSEGTRYHFNCDRSNHYIYEVDGTRREPNGRKKRTYKGVMATAQTLCHDEAERWEVVTHPENCPDCTVGRGAKGLVRPITGSDAVMAIPKAHDN